MRVATAHGLQTVSTRSTALVGLDHGSTVSGNGSALLRLVNGAGGLEKFTDYAGVYQANPWVFAAVEAYARAVSRLVLKVYVLDENGDRTRVRSDLPGSIGRNSAGQALDALLRAPDPGVLMSAGEWWRRIVRDRWVYGNALVEKQRDASGRIVALPPVPWKRVAVETGDRVPVLWYTVSGSKASRQISPLDVVHFGRGADLDSPVGMSPLKPLHATIALHDALMRHAVSYMANSARPSGMIQLDRASSKDVIDKVREQVRALYESPENAGRIIVGSGSFERFNDDVPTSGLIELAKQSREEVSAAFAIPQPILGILDRAILNNTKELRSYWTRDIVGPFVKELEDEMMAQLVGEQAALRSHFVRFDLDEILRPDLEARADVYEKLRHVLTPNEMREIEDRQALDVEGADTTWLPAGSIGLGIEPPAPPEVPPA